MNWCYLASEGVNFSATKRPLINYFQSEIQKSQLEKVFIPSLAAKIAEKYTAKNFDHILEIMQKIGFTFQTDISRKKLTSVLLNSFVRNMFQDVSVNNAFRRRLLIRLLKS